jgi:hypothetical protein
MWRVNCRRYVTARASAWNLCAIILVAVAWGVTACGSGTTAPSPPGPTPPTLRDAALGGLNGPIALGQTLQMREIAFYSDGTQRDVTNEAQWASSKPEVAAVMAPGLFLGKLPGATLVQATYQGHLASGFLTVVGPNVTGFVHESGPRNVCLAGARVEVADGPAMGQVAITDNDGRFVFTELQAAGFTLLVTRPGYINARFPVAEYPRDATANIAVMPSGPILETVWDGTFAPDQCGLPNSADGHRSLFFTTQADGVLVVAKVQMKVIQNGGARLYRGSEELPGQCPTRDESAFAVYAVTKGVEYELRIAGYGCNAQSPVVDGSFHVEFSRPQ